MGLSALLPGEGPRDRLLAHGAVALSDGELLAVVLHTGYRALCSDALPLERPLYLHQCDPVAGIEHFRTPLGLGPALLDELRTCLGGTSLPRLMVDLPGGGGKVPLDGSLPLRDLRGHPAEYPDDPS